MDAVLKQKKRISLLDNKGSLNGRVPVLLVDANQSRASLLKRALIEYGYDIVAKLDDVSNLTHQSRQYSFDAIVIGIDAPDTNALSAIAALNVENPHPIVMFAEKDTPYIIKTAVKAGVNAYIVDDIQPQRLKTIITVAILRFKEHQALVQELEQTKTKLEQRKVLERAKGLLMNKQGISEEEAYASIRKVAMDKGKTLAVTAENIIDVFSLIER